MKKLAALLLLAPGISMGAASLQMGTVVISTDGFTVTVPITGGSGSLSPSTGVTGFSAFDAVNSNTVGIASVNSAGTTVTITLSQPTTSDGHGVVFSLATSPTSNLTDAGSNTPSATGNTSVSSTNNSLWLAANGTTVQSACRTAAAGSNYNAGMYQGLTWPGPDAILRCNLNTQSITIEQFNYYNQWRVVQDGVDVGTGTLDTATTFSSHTLVTGLSGTHLYEIMMTNANLQQASAVPAGQTTQITAILFSSGTTFGSKPAARPIIGACGDSVTAYVFFQDDRQGDWWQNAKAFGYDDLHLGAAGQPVNGFLDTFCPTQTNYTTPASVVWLQGGHNDTGSYSSTTIKGAWVRMLEGVEANNIPKMYATGIPVGLFESYPDYSVYSQAVHDAVDYYNALSTTTIPVCFTDLSTWVPQVSGNYQADNLHWSAAGYALKANREIPINGGAILGYSYSVTGPSSGASGSPSTNFVVTLAGGATFTGDQTITLNDGGAGGTFIDSNGGNSTGPHTVTPTNGVTSFSFTYTPSSSGTKTISYTNGQQCWVNPSSNSYVSGGGGGGTTPTATFTGNFTCTGSMIFK